MNNGKILWQRMLVDELQIDPLFGHKIRITIPVVINAGVDKENIMVYEAADKALEGCFQKAGFAYPMALPRWALSGAGDSIKIIFWCDNVTAKRYKEYESGLVLKLIHSSPPSQYYTRLLCGN